MIYGLMDLKAWIETHGVKARVQGDVVLAECELITRHGAIAVDKEEIRTMAQAREFLGYGREVTCN